MARTKEYNIEHALSSATELFLRKGYGATSLSELVKTTGLNRYSMYSEFKDKEGLFLACVKHYMLEKRNLRTVEILTQEPLGIRNVEEFLQDRIDYALSDNCYGCLLVNMVFEREAVSQKINDVIEKVTTGQEQLIFKCIEAAIKKGEISDNNDSKALTDYFSCFFRGLMSMAKESGRNNTSLKKMGIMALCAIDK